MKNCTTCGFAMKRKTSFARAAARRLQARRVCSRHSLRPGGTAQPYARRRHPAGRDSNRRKPGCSCRPARARLAGTATGATGAPGVQQAQPPAQGRSPAIIRPRAAPGWQGQPQAQTGAPVWQQGQPPAQGAPGGDPPRPQKRRRVWLAAVAWCWCLRWAQQGYCCTPARPPPATAARQDSRIPAQMAFYTEDDTGITLFTNRWPGCT